MWSCSRRPAVCSSAQDESEFCKTCDVGNRGREPHKEQYGNVREDIGVNFADPIFHGATCKLE